MKLNSLVYFLAMLSSPVLATTFLSSSGQETYEPGPILEPESNEKLKLVLEQTYKAIKAGDQKLFPLALGAGGYYLENHWQGLSFGAHAFGLKGQPYLSTRLLKKSTLTSDDFKLDLEKRIAFVRVKSGNTQGQVLDMANAALPADLKDEFEFYMTGPSSEFITIGGALAAHTHYRSTYPYAGYYLDQVENFNLIAIQDEKATDIFCSRDENSDLFHAIPGTFGRGGVISDITLRLQLVPKDYRPTSTMRRFENLGDFQTAFSEGVAKLKDPLLLNEHNRNFVGINGFMSDNCYFIFNFDFEPLSKVKNAPYFDLFNKPNSLTFLGHYGSHSLHTLANFVTEYYVLRTEKITYQNELRPWLFFHNGYLEFRDTFDWLKKGVSIPKAGFVRLFGQSASETVFGRNMQTAHQAYVMKLAHYEQFMKTFQELLKASRYAGMNFKFRDFVPVPSTRTLMSPAYSEDPNDIFVVATLSWPVNTESEKNAIDALKKEISELEYVKVHPHKEFDPESDLLSKTYLTQAQKFEEILAHHHIDDCMIWTKMHKALFGKE